MKLCHLQQHVQTQIIVLSEVNQIEKDNYVISLICGIFKFLKNDRNELICKSETDLQILKITVVTKGEVQGERINQVLGINIHMLLYMRQITSKNLLYSPGNYTQYFVITYVRKVSEKESVQFSRSVLFDPSRPHELQHARPPCPSPTPVVHPNPCPLSW